MHINLKEGNEVQLPILLQTPFVMLILFSQASN